MLRQYLFVTLVITVYLLLAEAVEDAQITVLGILDFLCDHLLCLTVVLATLRMPNHDMVDLVVLDVVSGNLACVCAFAVGATVLGTNHDAWLDNGLDQ